MARNFGTGLMFLVAVLSSMVELCRGSPATLTLERAFPVSEDVELSQVIARDRARHGRMLQSSSTTGVVNFPVAGTFDPYVVGYDHPSFDTNVDTGVITHPWLYYTKVQLGNPAKDFYVQIDTGSDVLWVGCSSCSGCPSKSGLKISLKPFDPKSSSSASEISCSDKRCVQGQDATCSTDNNLCSYSFQYGDGSSTNGYYISDTLHFSKSLGGSTTTNSSASVVFGCSTNVTGQLTKTDRAVDGIFGFGQQSLSVISQLYSQGVSPNVFSHCLKGDDAGGGILVLGEIVDPNMIYSPMASTTAHYNLNLQSISVDGQKLNIDSSVFTTSDNGGTIIDSGTTLAYLAQGAYDTFVNAIDTAVSSSVPRVQSSGNICYLATSSLSSSFPQVAFNFEGNASMVLAPQDYLLKEGSSGGNDVWCIGFSSIQGQTTILGDLVLKDKIIVYDIAGQRIGWTSYDCSQNVNVSTTSNSKETVNAGGTTIDDGSSSLGSFPDKPTFWIAMTVMIISSFMFL